MQRLFLAIILNLVFVAASAQGMIGFYFKGQKPVGDFNRNVRKVPLGMGIDYFHHVRGSRFSIGGELGISMYTHFTYNGSLQNGQTFKIYEEDCFWTVHSELRYNFYQTPAVRVYASGRVGLTTFFSSLQSEDPQIKYMKTYTHGTAFNTGVGGGVMINWQKLFHPAGEASHTYIDIGATLHSGTRSAYRYVTRDSNIPIDQGRFNSLTNYWDFKLGLIYVFPQD